MSYIAKFKGWDKLGLSDLIVAYRKAKADHFFENSFPTAVKFAEYEQDLLENLKTLLETLQKSKGFKDNKKLLGDCRLIPKKLRLDPKKDMKNGHTHFSDHDREYEYLCEYNKLIPEFRIVGDFPVDAHVLSALWINMVGHKFDSCLDDSCYGARVRRIRNEEIIDKKAPKPFHITAIGSFAPYYQPYKKWRSDGLNAIRDELEKDRKVVAVSLDLRSYYHLLDPSVIAAHTFQKEIGLVGEKSLSIDEQDFTSQLSKLLNKWAKKAEKFSTELQEGKKGKVTGGLVIGLTASRIISNVVLHKWDALIREQITPIHYGRYVDDMFLVLRDPGTIKSTASLMQFLQAKLGIDTLSEKKRKGKPKGIWRINLGMDYQKKSVIELQADKQKLFVLQGQAGCDLLDSIEKEIYELSSEQRLMPSPDQLERSTAARVLSAAGSVGEEADSLRRADGLTIRRLSWSLQLRHVETLAHDLPANAWKKERAEFYQFAHNHILRPDQIFAHYVYLPRLLGFAISMGEWEQAEAIVRKAFHCLTQLAKSKKHISHIAMNGCRCLPSEKVWSHVHGSLAWSFIDAAAKYYDPQSLLVEKSNWRESKLATIFMDQLWKELDVAELLGWTIGSKNFYDKAPLLAICDLARTPYKRILSSRSAAELLKRRDKKKEYMILKAFEETELIDVDNLRNFLNSSRFKRLATVPKDERKEETIYTPYLFPTRPYSAAEIAELAPECVGFGKISEIKPQSIWAKYVRAMRGVWVKPALLEDEVSEVKLKTGKLQYRKRFRIGTQKKKSVVVAITNLLTEESAWAGSACNKPELTLDRYKRISELVNQALTIKPRPDYLLLPELSLPLQWVDSVSSRLVRAGISLIAGTEYRHYERGEIGSDACLALTDDRLGFPSSVRIWQPKVEPAVGEDRDLTSKMGKTWRKPSRRRKPIYIHNGVYFGVMVCSELSNSKERIRFQGWVDALMILSWNQDLDTFASLIESAALDVHAYTILVNNRKYGDSRVRAPSKESFRKDLARIRGGENDFCVVVKLDVDGLRAFQSRAKRWADKSDPFKPVPEGFEIKGLRRKLPPK
ncbi:RNA-directed DNA polymerase [Amphritea sp. 2_MG-2023]|uniref:RNA-directed DNA polymerase n=1 Tax=Amphritea TaxID=515417 RepID=UPI001C06D78D|nr:MULTISPECIES: RNA-directed DNA polymerase [Amphritea]MBU2966364.1 RNA-directed DNA polymerase [Amphritea atlantica]MDO6419802.1 RNA-directed DNA polymerase [Amphritea sp. 2_MG-2023]